jgi:RNA polymerase sigma factor (sigma-70 family)
MSFPQTRLTLVQRLASDGAEEDWQTFLKDYWGPICRFSLRFGAQTLDDAEDAASETFEALWEQHLLVRWASNRSAKLRTLLCCVARNILSHRNRVQSNRRERLQDAAEQLDRQNRDSQQQADAFYDAWVEDLVQQAVEGIAADYCRQGRADYIRVLYGRLCQGMTIAETAQALNVTPAAVDHYFRHARQQLAEKLEQLTRRQVLNYCLVEDAEQEFTAEWRQLGQYLSDHGGLEKAVERAYALLDPIHAKTHLQAGLKKAATRLTAVMHTKYS